MGADWKLQEAAERIKHAGLDPSSWSQALSFLAETIGSTGAVVFGTDKHVAHAPSSISLQQAMAEYSQGGWYERDCRREGVGVMLSAGIMTDHDMKAASFKTEFYCDFLPRHDCDWFAGVGFQTGDDLWCLAMERSAATGPFQTDEVERLKTLWRPLSDAATLTRVFADRYALATIDALELVEHAAVICDDHGEVLAFNEAATRLLGHSYDTKLKTIVFKDKASDVVFSTLVTSALNGLTASAASPLSADIVDDAGRVLTVRAISLSKKHEFVFYRTRLLLLFKEKTPSFASRMSKYRLTRAELAVADGLRKGGSVADIAQQQCVQINTIRAQLKSIFLKTGARSQSQLVALIYQSEQTD